MDDIIGLCLLDDVESVVSNVLESLLESNITTEFDLGLSEVAHRGQIVRNKNYYEVSVPRFNDDLFKKHFRMSRNSLEELIGIVGLKISMDSKNCGDLRKKLMFSLWMLTKQESFHAAGNRFGFAKSSAYMVFQDMVTVIASLLPRYIKWPNSTQSRNEADIFQRRSGGFPGVVGVVGACYIPIKGFSTDFYNEKTRTHSIVLQGTCDHKARFTDIFSGMPGKMDKASVFRESDLFTKLSDTSLPLMPSNMHILGDSSYPLLQNLMTPFKDNGQLNKKQTSYNVKLKKIETIIKRSFALLTRTFKRLKYLDCSTTAMGNKIIVTGCVLQNFLIDRNEIGIYDDNSEEVIGDEDEVEIFEDFSDEIDKFQENPSAIAMRKRIAEMLL